MASIREGKHGIEVKTYDKLRALELLGQHLGMFEARSEEGDDGDVEVTMSPRVKEYAK